MSTQPRTGLVPTARLTVTGGVGVALVAATVAAAGPAQAADHEVEPGDTVSHLALRYGTTTAAIVQANRLDQRALIRVGQVLSIPERSTATAATVAAAARSSAAYTVRSGDTVSAIAAKFDTTVAAIVAANGLDSRAFIRAGQVLTIPGAAAAPTVPTQASAPKAGSYTVASGDTVSAIAAKFGTTVAAIVGANGLDSRAFIRAGQVLVVPGAPAATSTSPSSGTSTVTSTYTVRSGDTVSAIAAKYGTTVAAVVAANGLDSRATIRVGQVLTLTTGSTSAAVTSGLVGSTFAGRTYPAATVASANQNKAALLAAGVPSRAEMQALVASTAKAMGVDPALALAIAYQESGFNHASVSPANAIGTMQVIPSSGEWASDLVGRDLNLLDPVDNVVAGVAILRALTTSAADQSQAIAGYYQGLASVRRNGMFADTRRYVASVQTLMSRFA